LITVDILNRSVLTALGGAFKVKTISIITRCFIDQIAQALIDDGAVQIPGLGTLTVHRRKADREVTLTRGRFKGGIRAGTRKVRIERQISVSFSKGPVFKQRLKEKHHAKARS